MVVGEFQRLRALGVVPCGVGENFSFLTRPGRVMEIVESECCVLRNGLSEKRELVRVV